MGALCRGLVGRGVGKYREGRRAFEAKGKRRQGIVWVRWVREKPLHVEVSWDRYLMGISCQSQNSNFIQGGSGRFCSVCFVFMSFSRLPLNSEICFPQSRMWEALRWLAIQSCRVSQEWEWACAGAAERGLSKSDPRPQGWAASASVYGTSPVPCEMTMGCWSGLCLVELAPSSFLV